MGKAIVTVQMSADASIGRNVGWFEGSEQEAVDEDEVHLAGALLSGRKTDEARSVIALFGDQGEPLRPADLWVPGDDHAGRCRPVPAVCVGLEICRVGGGTGPVDMTGILAAAASAARPRR